MKNKAQTKFYLTLAIIVLLFLISYMYLYKSWNQKTDEITASNQTLETRVNELRGYYEKMPEYKKEIVDKTNYINSQLNKYPSDTREEDAVYLALRSIAEDIGVAYKVIQVNGREVVDSVPKKTVVDAGVSGLEKELVLKQRTTTYSNVTNYSELKRLLECMNDETQQLAITSIAYAVNGEQMLEGTVDCTFYMLEGTEKKYIPREFTEYTLGVPALFGK